MEENYSRTRTFLRTFAETLYNGIGWSRSPMTINAQAVSVPRADVGPPSKRDTAYGQG